VSRSPEEQSRIDARLGEVFLQHVPFNHWLDVELAPTGPHGPSVRLAMRNELVGSTLHKRLHGGVIASVLDIAGGYALMFAIADKYADDTLEQLLRRFERMGTIDLRVDYLRPGIGTHFVATAEVTRLGGRVASVQMRLAGGDGTLISTGSGCYVVS
jgi:uncharacterized protein (TIGR00369 family)